MTGSVKDAASILKVIAAICTMRMFERDTDVAQARIPKMRILRGFHSSLYVYPIVPQLVA